MDSRVKPRCFFRRPPPPSTIVLNRKFDYQTIGQTDEGIATIAGTKRRNPYVRRGGRNCYEFTKCQVAKHQGKAGTEDGVSDSGEAAHGPRFFHGWRTPARGHDLRD